MAVVPTVEEAKGLVAEICRNFYQAGWVSGTGGGMSIKARDAGGEERIVMAPSGVQKERMQPHHMFVLDAQGGVVHQPPPAEGSTKPLKLSECSPLFMAAYELRGAGAVLHSHSVHAMAATLLKGEAAPEFSCTQLEMIKGIEGHGFYDDCVVPIIENTAREAELTGRLREAIAQYPKARAVLVRRHGIYVWGKDWVQCKTQAECYHYLFEAALRLAQLGVDVARAPKGGPAAIPNGHSAPAGQQAGAKRKAEGEPATANGHAPKRGPAGGRLDPERVKVVVLDIEGTIAPLTFTKELLYPYARRRLQAFLEETWDTEETRAAVDLLRAETEVESRELFPAATAGKYAEYLMGEDRKSTGLKAIQGLIWREGFAKGELAAELFSDVAPAMRRWQQQGLRLAIYSSGSTQAQVSALSHTSAGDLLPCLSALFDTTSGPKLEAASYRKIQLSLAVLDPQDILFASDNAKELDAASAAGWQVVMVRRPGNDPLPAALPHAVIDSFGELPGSLGG